jgi:hypothetical protein
MGRSPERKLVVKNSFLEIVETPFPHDRRNRSFTDGAIECMGRKDMDVLNSEIFSADYCNGAQLEEQFSAYPVIAGNDAGNDPCVDHEARLSEESACLARENGHHRGLPLILENSSPPRTAQWNNGSGGQWFEKAQNYVSHPIMPLAANLHDLQPGPNQTQRHSRNQNFAPQSYPGAVPSRQVRHESGNRAWKPFANNGPVGVFPPSQHLAVSKISHDPSAHYTTVMLRNLPNKYTRAMLLDMLDAEGFSGSFTFVYLPIDFKTHAGLGYAFVDLISPSEAQKLREHFEGFSRWVLASDKVCTVSWSHPEQQGHAAHVERYRNSPVMHESVPEDWKPVLFVDGRLVSFPMPTRKIRPPRLFPLKAMEQ